ncbi:MAG: hypothetical protein FJZ01_12830 [Candidatus Sericytochromatia bacterium]|nr:hypothetical protein [Candidatus Tanganyikabacteria bacterium]
MREYLRSAWPGAAVLAIGGCAWFAAAPQAEAPLALQGASGVNGVATTPAPYVLEGSVRVGLVANNASGLVSNNAGGLVSDNAAALSNGNPLTVRAPLARVTEVSAGLRVSPVEALSGATPVTALADGATYRAQATAARIVVEVVDPASGELFRRGKADAQGRYRFELSEPPARRGWIVQATEVSGATVSAFLAAPLPLASPGVARQTVDVTPASTLVVFTAALASGVRAELKVDTGFRGVKTEQLAAMVATLDGAAVKEAASKIDAGKSLGEPALEFEKVLDKVVSGSVALAQASHKLASTTGSKLANVVAAGNNILRAISREEAAPTDAVAAVDASAGKVEAAKVTEEAKTLIDTATDSAAILSTYVVVGYLDKDPTPTPAP